MWSPVRSRGLARYRSGWCSLRHRAASFPPGTRPATNARSRPGRPRGNAVLPAAHPARALSPDPTRGAGGAARAGGSLFASVALRALRARRAGRALDRAVEVERRERPVPGCFGRGGSSRRARERGERGEQRGRGGGFGGAELSLLQFGFVVWCSTSASVTPRRAPGGTGRRPPGPHGSARTATAVRSYATSAPAWMRRWARSCAVGSNGLATTRPSTSESAASG